VHNRALHSANDAWGGAEATTERSLSAVLAFAAALVSLRLAAELARRARAARPAPELTAWAFALASYAVATAGLAAGAAGGWHDSTFRVYYLFGGLLTVPLFAVGSVLRTGRSWVIPVGLLYAGLAAGVTIAVPISPPVSGEGIPAAQDHLAVFPARVLAIAANSLGTIAVIAVAVATIRARPLGNALILAGVATAALGSGIGLDEAGTALALAAAAVLLYAGVVVTPGRRVRAAPPGERVHSPPTM
jgi:hypothetical protein